MVEDEVSYDMILCIMVVCSVVGILIAQQRLCYKRDHLSYSNGATVGLELVEFFSKNKLGRSGNPHGKNQQILQPNTGMEYACAPSWLLWCLTKVT